MKTFGITVIGSGHAGIEAANIAAAMGADVLLVTTHADLIGHMSCNPAIGGVGKGNIVREIDALGGLMGSLIDRAGIHFRMLNGSKGSAVWGPRAQADKVLYRALARRALEGNPRVSILQAAVTGIGAAGGRASSVTLDSGEVVGTGAVIVAAGTFLNGVIHTGESRHAGGRAGEPPALGLTESIRGLGISSGRLKTCTPPRLDGRTVDYSKLAVQRGDGEPWPFSFFTKERLVNKVQCWSVKTNAESHKHILENRGKSPLFSEESGSAAPRYCPSIEDKVVRFGERDGHTLYLEPESLDNRELYVNGMATSLPYGVQERVIATIGGLEGARIMRPGYGIEYDYFQPLQLRPTLESRAVPGLFFAGQVNGTSGYEEAAGQGILAGINAALTLRGEEPLVLRRDESYIGVLVDDLVTKGTEEPYRMFTARAEHRLVLRQDNCDERLMPIAHRLGTIPQERYDERRRFWDKKRQAAEWLGGVRVTSRDYEKMTAKSIAETETARELLRRPEVRMGELVEGIKSVMGIGFCGDEGIIDRHLLLSVESDIKYEGFVKKQQREIERLRRYEEAKIPDSFSYDNISGLLSESLEKLKKIRPSTLGMASRISGVTPADISVLAMHLAKAG
ncbi:MAG: tRNA uridine-5-carboxymethylaminomethyl(34) synthesis enzyme MnmG [Chitinispirillales bacterium]|jgi:tRNA uridine 5-carboxymethylaminomethyl modification enzyme|nr:tRNA uridine-5-carboxymethylaminomethyl(34) synthesis enzyme MnmG [Chitinispirillales bacterium]